MASNGTIDQLNFKVVLNDKEFTAKIDKDIAKAKELNAQITKLLSAQGKLNADTTKQMVNQEKVAKAAAQTAAAQERVRTQAEKTATAVAKTAAAEQKVKTEAEKTASAHARAQREIEKTANRLAGGGNSLLRGWLRFSATLWSIVSVVRIFTRTLGSWIKKISEFEQANANLATIMQVSRREVSALTEDALMLGRTTEWTASQVTSLQTALAKLGYNIPQIQNMQESVLQFATSVGADLPEAANLAGASLRMFGMYSSQTQQALEILTAATNKTALDFEKLKVSLPYVGAIAHTIGFDISETASLLGVLANSGLAASRTGTGLRQVLLRLSKDNSALQEAMGGNIKTFDDFVNGLELLRDRGIEVGEAQKLVGDRAGAALLILANGVDDIRRLNTEMRDTDGLLKKIQKDRLETLHGSTLLLKSAWEGLIQTFRDSTGAMKDVVDWLTKIINKTSLAVSRTNRVAQGTKDVVGSDTLTKQFKEHFNSLVASGYSPREAQQVIQEEMENYYNGAASDNKRPGMYQKGWYKVMTDKNQIPIVRWITKGVTRKARAADEQQDAAGKAMETMTAYMEGLAGEGAEAAANAYLESWKAVFDAEGEDAAREAMAAVADTELIKKMKKQMENYIAIGGAEGEVTPSTPKKENTPKLSLEQKAYIAIMEETERALNDEFLKLAATNTKELEKQLDAREKALENYEKLYKDWSETDFGKQGTGAMYKISSAVTEYKNKDKQADDKYYKGLALAQQAHKGNAKAIETERQKLRELRDLQKEMNRTEFEEKVRGMAKDLYEEGMFGYDMTNWSDKSISQINEIRSALEKLDVPDDVKKELEGYSGALDAVTDELKKLKEEKIDKTVDPERWKKIAKQAKYIAQQFLKVSDTLKELGSAYGNAALVNFAESVGAIAEVAESAYEGYKVGGAWGAVIGGAIDAINQILGGMTEAEKKAKELRDAIVDVRVAAASDSFKSLLSSGTDGIFGSNTLKGIRNATEGLQEVADKLKSLDDWIKQYRADAEKYVLLNGGALYSLLPGGSENTLIRTGQSRWGASEEFATIEHLAQQFGRQLWDDNGNLNPALLQDILNTYGDLNSELTEWLKNGIEYANEYAEAMKQIEDVAKEILGDVAADVADKIVDSWWEAGQAALDYADILEDVAKGYAKLVVQDALMDAAFTPEKKQAFIEALKSGDAQTAMATVASAMEAAKEMLPVVEQSLQAFEPYRTMSGGEGSSLGSGVKSISEETANLLASYINAIRADVSYMRGIQEKGWEGVNAFIPTLNDHIAQISATNFDIAQSNQSILSELRSVIGAPGTSGMVVRVESY